MLDSPGTYIMMMVLGLIILPFYIKSVNNQMKNPEDYYSVSFGKRFFIGLLMVLSLILYGLYNYLRFVR